MDATTKKIVIVGGLVIVGYLVYTKFIAPGMPVSSGAQAQIDSGTLAVLNSWAASGGTSAPQLTQFVNSMNPSEAAFTADLITNYWNKGIAPSYDQDSQWVELKAKYGVS